MLKINWISKYNILVTFYAAHLLYSFYCQIIMKKQRKLTQGEQEALLQNFYDELENEDFLGNGFIGDNEEVGSQDEDSDNDSEVELPGEEVHVDVTMEEKPNEEEEITIEHDLPLPRKQKFTNLAASYSYTDARKTFTIHCKTLKDDRRFFQRRGKNNMLKNTPGPRRAAKRVTTPVEAFELFITNEMLEKIFEYTNASTDPFLRRYGDLIENSNKYSWYKPIDLTDIRTFLGILYLRAAFKLNLLNQNKSGTMKVHTLTSKSAWH